MHAYIHPATTAQSQGYHPNLKTSPPITRLRHTPPHSTPSQQRQKVSPWHIQRRLKRCISRRELPLRPRRAQRASDSNLKRRRCKLRCFHFYRLLLNDNLCGRKMRSREQDRHRALDRLWRGEFMQSPVDGEEDMQDRVVNFGSCPTGTTYLSGPPGGFGGVVVDVA